MLGVGIHVAILSMTMSFVYTDEIRAMTHVYEIERKRNVTYLPHNVACRIGHERRSTPPVNGSKDTSEEGKNSSEARLTTQSVGTWFGSFIPLLLYYI